MARREREKRKIGRRTGEVLAPLGASFTDSDA